MIIIGHKPNNLRDFSSKKKFENFNISFTSSAAPPALYEVKNSNIFKKALPAIAFISAALGSLGYLLGATGLFYDVYHDKKNKKPSSGSNKEPEEGVKTITANTEFGKFGIKCAKMAIITTATSGVACGLGEGLPLMTLGEVTNFSSAKNIETPVGTGLFGIGIASIFASLALDNTPNLKLDEFKVMAEKSKAKKAKMILSNMFVTGKEISKSLFEIAGNIFNKEFLKKNIFQGTPTNIIFSEAINRDGKVILSKTLRHNKNYLMHAASFTLGLGGFGIIISSYLDAKKPQKASLKVEEGGFLFDNIGITRYGIDKFTINGKSAGASFAVGGVINAISQFIGLDNKDGRALQWLGIAGVFLGYSIDRGKNLKKALAQAKQRPELTKIVREWKIDLSEIIQSKTELKKLLKELKIQSAALEEGKEATPITNSSFLKLEKAFTEAIGKGNIQEKSTVQNKLNEQLEKNVFDKIKPAEIETNLEETKNILQICTEKILGKNPKKIENAA